MIEFEVEGPFVVPLKRTKKSREIKDEELDAFWENNGAGEKRGVYIFANCVGGGCTPIYVGKTQKNFQNECFTPHKRMKLQRFFNDAERIKLGLYFISTKTRPSAKIIDGMESYFIQTAVLANSDLQNDRKTMPKWAVPGICGTKANGQPTKALQSLKGCLNLKK